MKEDIKNYLKYFKDGTKTMFKEFFNKETNKKQRANMLSFSRIIIPIITIIISIIGILTNTVGLFLVSGIIAGIGGLTDLFDGPVARKTESVSEYGKLLDQFTDKWFSIMLGINLVLINPTFLILLAGEGIIGAVNTYYKFKYKDIDIKSSIIGKAKQFPLFTALGFGYISPFSNLLLSLTNMLVYITGVTQLIVASNYLVENEKQAKEIERKKYCNKINENIEKANIENKKGISIDNELNNNITINQNNRLEQYKQLRDLLNQIINKEKVKENIEVNQKIKK